MKPRVVFDTGTVLSALLFPSGHLAWLRGHWQGGECESLVSRVTVEELNRVLSYPKFKLSEADRHELLADYLPYCKTIKQAAVCPLLCRDPGDQAFLDLAQAGHAAVLVSGDSDLLSLREEARGQGSFVIENPAEYRIRFPSSD